MSKLQLFWHDNGPMRADIEGVGDAAALAFVEHEIDAFASDCECDGPECDPETCPRFCSECSECGASVPSGEGVVCMDSGGVIGECCIEWLAPTQEGGAR